MGLGHWLVSKPSLFLLLNGTCWYSASCRMLLWNGIASWLISRPVSAMPCVSADCLMAVSNTTGALSLCLTFSFLGVWMSCGFHNGVPQTGWLKTNRNVLSHIFEPEAPNQGVSQVMLSPKALRENFSWLTPRPGGPRHSRLGTAMLQPLPPSPHGSTPCACHLWVQISLW